MIHHQGGGLHIDAFLFLVLPILLGAVDDGPDDAGNGDVQSPQQGQHGGKTDEKIRHGAAAGPAEQNRQSAAEHSAASAVNAAEIQVREQSKAFGNALGLNRQVVDAAAQQHKGNGAHAPHDGGFFPAKGIDKEQIQQRRDRKIEPSLSDEAGEKIVDCLQKQPLGVDADDQKQHKQHQADNGRDGGQRNPAIVLRFHLGRFGGCPGILPGLGSGGILFCGGRLLPCRLGFLFCHGSISPYAIRFRIKANSAIPQQ